MGNDIPTSEKGQNSFSVHNNSLRNSYAGDISPQEVWKVLSEDSKSVLVDVRTQAEWSFVGVPDLTVLNKEVVFIPWRMYPTMAINAEFVNQFVRSVPHKEAPVFFICRSGHRSMDAAIEITRYGYKQCYNVAGGFEGDVDANRHRSNKNGWKLDKLPWGQS